MFRKAEKTPIINMVLWFFFYDLIYRGEKKKGIIEFLILVLTIGLYEITNPPIIPVILTLYLLYKRIPRLIGYIREYESIPGFGD
mgnify:CR=1 FL=1